MIIHIIFFMLLASPFMFRLTSGLLGSWIANSDGLPTIAGLFLHAIVFIIVTHVKISGFSSRDHADDQSNRNYQKNRFIVT